MLTNISHHSDLSTTSVKEKAYSLAKSTGNISNWDKLSAPSAVIQLKELLTFSELKILKECFHLFNKHDFVFPSQKLIATMAKVSLSTVKRAITKFESLEIMSHMWRAYTSNSYDLNPFFRGKRIQKILRTFFVNFSYTVFSMSLLASKVNEPLLSNKVEANYSKSYNRTLPWRETVAHNYADNPPVEDFIVPVDENLWSACQIAFGSLALKPSSQEIFSLEGTVYPLSEHYIQGKTDRTQKQSVTDFNFFYEKITTMHELPESFNEDNYYKLFTTDNP